MRGPAVGCDRGVGSAHTRINSAHRCAVQFPKGPIALASQSQIFSPAELDIFMRPRSERVPLGAVLGVKKSYGLGGVLAVPY